MGNKTIYLIRHGETEYNRLGIVQGSGIDSSLNDVGIAQADAFFQTYQYVPFDKIYTSALKRTIETAQPFIDLKIPHQQLSGLNEISWGEKEGKVPNYQQDGDYKDLITAWKNGDFTAAAPGGESPEQVVQRQREALKTILDDNDEELILVVMHGRALRILLTHLTEQPISAMDTFHHSNVCLYKLTFNAETEEIKIVVANDTSHLMMVHG
ncbi:MAG: histidine phosphatase family protein [Spirosomaceae bacterium]|nr:histidine phosphatase family protein [Spirosomataceae bacterium]